ncbi:MAG: Serine/threonine protein kinase [Myxococcales bacterium]|nr:Serine/threonine protein kinase [Myxococcales bacterium]
MADDKKQKTLFLDDAGAAAPPQKDAPLSSQSTMMMEAPANAPRQVVTPTIMKEPPRHQLAPMQRPKNPSTAGRWIAGPILAAVVATGTVFGADQVMPRHKKGVAGLPANAKPQGKLRVNTTPPGASILVDGKRFPRFTPAVIEADVDSTVKLTFTMDGFKSQDADVYVTAGEHAFTAKLTPAAAEPVATPEPTPAPKKEHHASTPKAPKEPVGEASISIRVRPWAIVFIDKQRLRQTPIVNYKLPSGKHTIELANEGKNRREKIDLNLKPGEAQELTRDWEK